MKLCDYTEGRTMLVNRTASFFNEWIWNLCWLKQGSVIYGLPVESTNLCMINWVSCSWYLCLNVGFVCKQTVHIRHYSCSGYPVSVSSSNLCSSGVCTSPHGDIQRKCTRNDVGPLRSWANRLETNRIADLFFPLNHPSIQMVSYPKQSGWHCINA